MAKITDLNGEIIEIIDWEYKMNNRPDCLKRVMKIINVKD